MNNDNEKKKLLPPYLSYKTINTFFDSLRAALPLRIDRSLMKSMSGGLQSQLMTALEFLDLISPDTGNVTEKLQRIVHSDGPEKQKALKEIITSSYPFVFQDDFDLKRATQKHLNELFVQTGATGDTLRKAIAFFLKAAEDAGLEISPHLKGKRGPRAGGTRQKRKNDSPTPSQSSEATSEGQVKVVAPLEDTSLEKLLLSKFPAFDPAWAPEVQAKWFDGFDKLTDRFKKKGE